MAVMLKKQQERITRENLSELYIVHMYRTELPAIQFHLVMNTTSNLYLKGKSSEVTSTVVNMVEKHDSSLKRNTVTLIEGY